MPSSWHTGYGGGLWLAPYNKIVRDTLTASKEESLLPMMSLGFQF